MNRLFHITGGLQVVAFALVLSTVTDAHSKDWVRFQESSWDPSAPVVAFS